MASLQRQDDYVKKLLTALTIIIFTAISAAAEPRVEGIGLTLPVFLTQMGTAARQVKWGYSTRRIESEMIATGPGGFAAEYNSAIVLYINMLHDRKLIKNLALSFIVSEEAAPEARRSGIADGEEQFSSLCEQLLIAVNTNTSLKGARRLLHKLGLFGPVLDGRQRVVRADGLAYIMKLQPNGTIILVVSPL